MVLEHTTHSSYDFAMKPFDVTLLTYEKQPELTPDDQLLQQALERKGVRVRVSPWSDASTVWGNSTVTMFRSTWDYFHRTTEFEGWLRRVEQSTSLVNDCDLVRWNMHKRYIADIERRGVAVVPTIFLKRKEPQDLMEVCRSRGWSEIVIKPCVAGSAFGARKFKLGGAADEGCSYLKELVLERDTMIQPFMNEVESAGERSLVFIDGGFSHAARKAPFSAGPAGGQSLETVHHADAEEIAFGRRVLDTLPSEPVYARVDIVPAEGRMLVMEVELIEPVLFFRFAPLAADALAEVLVRKLKKEDSQLDL
jgi:glutathione synthase/RimK-type ligase-like ATP-grasp enzyme